MKNNIYDMTFSALESYFQGRGENKAKAKIVYNHVYKNRVKSFAEIENLSDRIKAMLSEDFSFSGIEILEKTSCTDAEKFLFGLENGEVPPAGGVATAGTAAVEAVLMRHDYGNALCVSTQIGCNMGCAFCRSGVNKKTRDLTSREMVLQLLLAEENTGEKINRVTLMGIGEPLDNFDNVMDFINIIGHRHGPDIAPRHITISTCGVEKLDNINTSMQFNIAISLHAPNDEIRGKIMPVNKTYNIEKIMRFVRNYTGSKNKKITLEYVMLAGINDSDENAVELSDLVKGVNCYVNLIPYNETDLGFKRSSEERVKAFYSTLIQNGVRAVVRREFGAELKAACGQLSSERKTKA